MKCQAVLLCVLALYLHQGEAVTSKCHQCSTKTEPYRCADPFNSTLMKDMECSSTDTKRQPCYKSITIEHGKRVVTRGCPMINTDYCGSIKDKTNVAGGFCGTCSTDHCNGSSGVLPSALLMLVASFAVLTAAFKK